jgi:two-component system, OmpR family, response regulator RegX3
VRIAVLQDDASQIELLSQWIRLAGHKPHIFRERADLVRALQHQRFDTLLLDCNVVDPSGIDVLNHVRRDLRLEVPVLFSSARSAEADIVEALRQGADDYMVKPARRRELLARLEAVARRGGGAQLPQERFEVGIFKVDWPMRMLLRDSEPLKLTAKDFHLSALFLRNVGRLLSRAYLQENAWNGKVGINSRTLDTYISRIRNKLSLTPENGWRLTSVYGYGYRLEEIQLSRPSKQHQMPRK